MACKACLWYWLFITRLLSTSAIDTVYNILPPQCLDGTKGNLDGMRPFLPESLLNNNRGYLCQKSWGNTGDPVLKERIQYLTLYDFTHRIPIYSAYVAEPWTEKNGEWVDNVRDEREEKFQDFTGKERPGQIAKNADYVGWDTIDRGHLFPVQFTRDHIESKATMKMTNTVPQDATFNQQQWKTAETILKKVAIKHCQAEEKGKPFIITGSVPDYFVGEHKEPFKIGCDDDDMTKICPRGKMRVTVPTHMWTTLRCQTKLKKKNDKGETVIVRKTTFHTSFIGANFKGGKVVWYEKFSAFEKDLMTMLNVKTPLFTEDEAKPKDEKIPEEVYQEIRKDPGPKGSQSFHEGDQKFAKWHSGPTYDLYALRKGIFEQRLRKELQHMGVHLKRLSLSLIPNTVSSKDPPSPPPTYSKQPKRGRDPTPDKDKNQDPDADIEVFKILIKETYQNGEETQTLDLTGKQIIADRNNKNENKFTASLNIDGEETELAEVPSTEKFIRIELKPRSEL